MSEIKELRDLRREYIAHRNNCHARINQQDRNLRNCAPSLYTIRACRENEAKLLEEARKWQERIDAIQAKLDEAIGLPEGGESE